MGHKAFLKLGSHMYLEPEFKKKIMQFIQKLIATLQ